MPTGLKLNGFIVYNKLDKVISHFEMNYDQNAFGTTKLKIVKE